MEDRNSLDLQAQKDFEFTQNIRKNMVMELTKTGPLPSTREDAVTLLTAMKDIDSQHIQRLRVKAEETNAGNLGNVAAMVSTILREVNPSAFAFAAPTRETTNAMVKMLPDSVEKAVIVPGELAVDPPQGDYASFVARMKS